MDVSGGIPAGLDASSPCRHDDAVPLSPVAFVSCSPTGEPLFPSEVWGKACVTIGHYRYLFKRLTALPAGRFYRFEHIVAYSSGKVVAK